MVSNKIALVTGNAKGIGKALSDWLVANGYSVPYVLRSKDFDLACPQSALKLAQELISTHGRIDLLINNVGNYVSKYIDEISLEEWHDMINSNLNSAFYLCKAFLPHLRLSKGQIVNLGFAGLGKLSPNPNVIAYQVAKTGLLVLTKGMAVSEAKHGLRVNMISPGSMINTVVHGGLDRIPLGRLGKYEELISVLEMVLNNQYLTGQNIEVAGGYGL